MAEAPSTAIPAKAAAFRHHMRALSGRLAGVGAIKVVAIGSSTTAGEGDIVPYPQRLETALRNRFGGRPFDVLNRGVGGEEAPDELRRIRQVATAGGDQRRAADLAEVRARVVDVVGVPVDPEHAEVRIAAAHVRTDQPQRGAREARKPGKCPRAERGPTLTPPAGDKMLDRPVFVLLHIAGNAVRRGMR